MPDATRAAMTRRICMGLTDPGFRRCLTAMDSDGVRPLIVALREDLMRDLVEKIHRAGGMANVVVPALNGFMVLEMGVEPSRQRRVNQEGEVHDLAWDCTVGLFAARLRVDDVGTRYFLDVGEGRRGQRAGGSRLPTRGRARVVALGS